MFATPHPRVPPDDMASDTSGPREVGAHIRVLLLLLFCWGCQATGGAADWGASVPPDAAIDAAGADTARVDGGRPADGGRADDAALDGGEATGDPRCSLANCQNLYACGWTLPATPDVSGCARRSGQPANPDDRVAYCPAACNAGHAGAGLACLAAPATMCSLKCGGQGTSDPGLLPCFTRCDNIRSACQDACPAASYRACLDCTFQCSVVALSCYAACDSPRDGGQP